MPEPILATDPVSAAVGALLHHGTYVPKDFTPTISAEIAEALQSNTRKYVEAVAEFDQKIAAHIALQKRSGSVGRELNKEIAADSRALIDYFAAGVPPELPVYRGADIAEEYTRLMRALQLLVETELPAAGRAAMVAQGNKLLAQAAFVRELVAQREQWLAVVSLPLVQFEGPGIGVMVKDQGVSGSLTEKLKRFAGEMVVTGSRILEDAADLDHKARRGEGNTHRFDPNGDKRFDTGFEQLLDP
jgi:hypothetical protein